MTSAPKCTSWLGHRFEARYSTKPPSVSKIGQSDAMGAVLVFESLTTKTYEGDVCTRCGCVVNRRDEE